MGDERQHALTVFQIGKKEKISAVTQQKSHQAAFEKGLQESQILLEITIKKITPKKDILHINIYL